MSEPIAPPPHATAPDARTPSGLPAVHVAAFALRNGWQPRRYGTSVLGTPLVAWWPSSPQPTRLLVAAIHGEEAVTLQLAHQLLRTVHADDACAVVVPVANPDGVLAGTRQNARGVDLNRNFPTEDWVPTPSPTFWPTTTIRTAEHRTQLSSPGSEPGSEPETQALMQLVAEVSPSVVVDLHTPLQCVIARSDAALELAQHLAEPAALPIVRALESPTPGDFASWCEPAHGCSSITIETELAPMPQLWPRHVEGLVRCIVERRNG